MSLSLRIFFVYIVFVGFCGYFILQNVTEEIKPGVRQSTEETLVDTANLLAEFLREPMLDGSIKNEAFSQIFSAYGKRQLNAKIWGINKSEVNHRVYITDNKGIVLLDSKNIAVGQDYSRWNDVNLTLRGEYGVRSSKEIAGDELSTVMYVAAPIKNGADIIGVVSVAKPNSSVQPFIDRAKRRLVVMGSAVIILGLVSGALFSWWLSRELGRLREYALAVSRGQRVTLPVSNIASGELRQLAQALESMRTELDGKAYIERYIQTLAHELKSPLTGIRATTEILQSPLLQTAESENERQKFIQNIDNESFRLQQIIERLLMLALVEQQQTLHEPKPIAIKMLWDELLEAQAARITRQKIHIENLVGEKTFVTGELFLLRQAFSNLLENALDFTPAGGQIVIAVEQINTQLKITVANQGEPIPEFALPRLTERFYSLPRPVTGRKSTGLGLNFVQEVMTLHGGSLELNNNATGVAAVMIFAQAV